MGGRDEREREREREREGERERAWKQLRKVIGSRKEGRKEG